MTNLKSPKAGGGKIRRALKEAEDRAWSARPIPTPGTRITQTTRGVMVKHAVQQRVSQASTLRGNWYYA